MVSLRQGGDMRSVLITVLWLFTLQPAMAGELYRWVDSAGNVHYGDVPPVDAEQLQEKKFDAPASAVTGDEALPFEVRRAKQRFPVTLYVGDNCKDPCQQARALLNQRHIPFTEKRLVTKDEFDELKQKSGGDILPTLSVGGDWLKGFLAQAWQDELDAAGYPK
jgi:Domain of unknown function (DUF4124)